MSQKNNWSKTLPSTKGKPQMTTELQEQPAQAPVKIKNKRKNQVAATSGKIEPQFKMIDTLRTINLKEIVSNTQNSRKALPNLMRDGWGIFQVPPDSDKPTLQSKALSDDPKEKADFCKLIEKSEPGIVESANNVAKIGQLQNPRVRVIAGQDGLDLVLGARRSVIAMYLHAKYNRDATMDVSVVDCDDANAFLMASSENYYRLNPDPVEEGLQLAELKKKFNMTNEQMESHTGIPWQTVRNRILLATSNRLTPVQRTAVSKGDLTVTKAMAVITNKPDHPTRPTLAGKGSGPQKNGSSGGRRTAPRMQDWQHMYEERALEGVFTEEVRKFLFVDVLKNPADKYLTFKKLQDMKKEAEKAAAKEAHSA